MSTGTSGRSRRRPAANAVASAGKGGPTLAAQVAVAPSWNRSVCFMAPLSEHNPSSASRARQ
eukprot:scaffold13389_cov134-Isochrysis_galbana.AAC.1